MALSSFKDKSLIESIFKCNGIPGPLSAILYNGGFDTFIDQGDKVSFVYHLKPGRLSKNLFFKIEFKKSNRVIYLTLGYLVGSNRVDIRAFPVTNEPLGKQVNDFTIDMFEKNKRDTHSYIPIIKSSPKDWALLKKSIIESSELLGFGK